jgi:uncharacterized Zn finger protein (UPF0148 family)
MKTCNQCGCGLFKVEFKAYGIILICASCGEKDVIENENYEG